MEFTLHNMTKIKKKLIYIEDKTKDTFEFGGTGIIAGLENLYNNNNLVKIKVGDQGEIDLRT